MESFICKLLERALLISFPTPSQNDEFLYVTIYAPFTNLDETEVFMDGSDFRFYSKPYYLRSAMARRSFKASVAKQPSYGGSAALVFIAKD